jgi:hypothetical protein
LRRAKAAHMSTLVVQHELQTANNIIAANRCTCAETLLIRAARTLPTHSAALRRFSCSVLPPAVRDGGRRCRRCTNSLHVRLRPARAEMLRVQVQQRGGVLPSGFMRCVWRTLPPSRSHCAPCKQEGAAYHAWSRTANYTCGYKIKAKPQPRVQPSCRALPTRCASGTWKHLHTVAPSQNGAA